MKKILKLYLLLIICISLTACSKNSSKTEVTKSSDDTSYETSISTTSQEKKATEKIAEESTHKEAQKATKKATPDYSNITQKTKDFILNGQDNISVNKKINWSETFLNQVNISDVYKKYLSAGGKSDDIQSFAYYLTNNAPIADNWQDLVATDLLNMYDKKISNIKHLEGNLYQVYVDIDGSDEPLVVVNSRTGYFHG